MASHIEIANIIKTYFPTEYHGVLIEVGAGHPTEFSISSHLRSDWKIISIEPNPGFVKEFQKLGLECLPYACCSEDKGTTNFHVSPSPMSASAIEVRYIGNYPIIEGAGGWWADNQFKTISVEALTLNTILKRHHPNLEHIDVLIVDTEGWELDVIQGFDLKKFSPKVVILEDASPKISAEINLDTINPVYYTAKDGSRRMFLENCVGLEILSDYHKFMRNLGYRQDREELQDKFYTKEFGSF